MKYYIFTAYLLLITLSTFSQKNEAKTILADWEEGYLDIHFINTGGGDMSFVVLPDGTTLLIDAGKLNKKSFEKKFSPLKVVNRIPNDSISVADWGYQYIMKAMPKNRKPAIDYALVTHFHSDHFGSLVELGKQIPIKNIIDRNYPAYNFPINLRQYLSTDTVFQEYISFIEKYKIPAQSLKVGSANQITLLKTPQRYPNFTIKNIKANSTIWSGIGDGSFEYFTANDMTTYYEGKYNENPLSLALKINYGDFDFFTGGDNTGLQGFGLPTWFDVETPMAKVVGEVDVTTLNHHGNRDATNEFFVNMINPSVVVQQVWCSDHPGQEVYQRLIYKMNESMNRILVATNMHNETIITYGPWFKDNYKSMRGHIVVRVQPTGKKYNVFVLEDTNQNKEIKFEFGPYTSKN